MEVMTDREFHQASSEARRLANSAPLFITDCGRPAHVLMSYAHYQALKGNSRNLADLLALDEDVELDLPERPKDLARDVDLS